MEFSRNHHYINGTVTTRRNGDGEVIETVEKKSFTDRRQAREENGIGRFGIGSITLCVVGTFIFTSALNALSNFDSDTHAKQAVSELAKVNRTKAIAFQLDGDKYCQDGDFNQAMVAYVKSREMFQGLQDENAYKVLDYSVDLVKQQRCN